MSAAKPRDFLLQLVDQSNWHSMQGDEYRGYSDAMEQVHELILDMWDAFDDPSEASDEIDRLRARCAELEKDENERYVVWSHEHSAWWRPNSAGYCRDVCEAGVYSREEAVSISHTARDRWHPGQLPDELPVRVCDLPEFARAALADSQP